MVSAVVPPKLCVYSILVGMVVIAISLWLAKNICDLRRELVAICEWDALLFYCLSDASRETIPRGVASYRARVVAER